MKILKLHQLLLITIVGLFMSCSSNKEECFEKTTIQQFYNVGNQIYSYDIEKEIPCGIVSEAVNIAPPLLVGFKYEVIKFEYTPDTGNNTTRLEFEIKLINPNSYSVKGFPYFTILNEGLEFSTNYAGLLQNSCNMLDANSSCIVKLNIEENKDLGVSNSFELLDVKYYLTN